MAHTSIPAPNPEYQLEELDNELLLYHPAKTKTLYMNETASLVWQLCDGARSVGEIIDLLRESYPEAEDSLPEDVRRTLEVFLEHGAISYLDQ
jgi:predicted DNA-binding protein (MmcQ/YjbR family)